MAKLTKYEKQERKALLDVVNRYKGAVFSFPEYSVTAVVTPSTLGSKSRFVRVAISHCSDKDTFKRKRGELVALEAWTEGYNIPIRSCGDLYEDALAIVLASI